MLVIAFLTILVQVIKSKYKCEFVRDFFCICFSGLLLIIIGAVIETVNLGDTTDHGDTTVFLDQKYQGYHLYECHISSHHI